MYYGSYRPVMPLEEFVDFFWMIAGGETDRKERILPSGTSELVINLREDEVRIYDSIHPERYTRLSGAVVSGTYSGAFTCDAMQHQSMLGVHFRPGGAFPFLGIPATEVTNHHVNLGDLWGPSPVLLLRERLREATTMRQRFQLLEEALLERLRRSRPRPHTINAVLRNLVPVGGGSTRDLAQDVGLSQRRFIQLFATHVGLTPKLLRRILRFQQARALAEVTGGQSLTLPEKQPPCELIDWAEIAIACGYYDQSHFINDFRNFAGLSPEQYLRHLRPTRRLKDNHLPVFC